MSLVFDWNGEVNVTGKLKQNGQDIAEQFAEAKNDSLVFHSTVGFQSKNILKNFTAATTKENEGITYEISDDGTVVCNGTTTSAHSYCYLGGYFEIAEENSFVLSGCPLGGSEQKYALQVYKKSTPNATIEINEFGNGYTKTLAKGVYQGVIVIRANQTVENLTFKPMLRLSGTDSNYTPYVPNIVDRLDNKLGKTETAAAAVCDGVGGNIAEQFADITVKNSNGWIYAGSSQQGWHKAAECAYAEASSGRRIASFYISSTTMGVGGILNVNVLSASNSTLSVRTLTAHWVYRSSSINPENFVLVAKLEEGKIIAELWVKLTSTYQAYNFIRVRSVKLTTEIYDDTAWKACNSTIASESYPSDYDLTFVSVDNSSAKYDASGNDIAETYLTHGTGIHIPSGSDINDSIYLVPGVYIAESNAVAETLSNCPTKKGFRMEVKASTRIDRLVRFMYPNTVAGAFYMQNVTADGIGSWYKFVGEEVTTSTVEE